MFINSYLMLPGLRLLSALGYRTPPLGTLPEGLGEVKSGIVCIVNSYMDSAFVSIAMSSITDLRVYGVQ